MSTWAYIENIVLIAAVTFLSFMWDTAWPLLILLFVNVYRRETK